MVGRQFATANSIFLILLATEPDVCSLVHELRSVTNTLGCVALNVNVSSCDGHCRSRSHVLLLEPYIQQDCSCCHGEVESVDMITLMCPDGTTTLAPLAKISHCGCKTALCSVQGGKLFLLKTFIPILVKKKNVSNIVL